VITNYHLTLHRVVERPQVVSFAPLDGKVSLGLIIFNANNTFTNIMGISAIMKHYINSKLMQTFYTFETLLPEDSQSV